MSRAALRLSTVPTPDATIRLVCFAFAGGGVMPFRRWSGVLDDRTELWGVSYPGREAVFGFSEPRDWEGLVRWSAEAVLSRIPPPYVLFGHSMGALVAHDVARLLAHEGPTVRRVIVSGHRPPQRRPHHSLALLDAEDTDLLAWMIDMGGAPVQALSHPDLRALAVELFRQDLRTLSTYRHRDGPLLTCDLHVVRGQDELMTEADLADWAEATSGRTTFQVLPGGHFYTPDAWDGLPGLLQGRVEGAEC
ncbi:thioesterase II family protein [Nocardiopsis sp. JB363]|uniref:thioesterase II family protein n=1 Tax=Nocardiopsis sp. JB363 TaxID=1434837 RepID=UPI00097ACADF|nr:alpha/beta fold hydrolase [Nocardiopsis sp. JB363]SIO90364.1 Thioesterase in siderophore biosynthesis gene cluster [Nocardiopsis sp. JB363]